MTVISSATEWRTALAEFPARDSYFTYDYHRLEADKNGFSPYLYLYETDECRIAIPLLLRDIEGTELKDATSVYGYVGPLQTGSVNCAQDFRRDLKQSLSELGVVSVFSRMHPLFNQSGLLDELGSIVAAGQTVSIDLAGPRDEQWAQYRSNLRREVRALRQSDVQCVLSNSDKDIATFTYLYNATMLRRDAPERYLVSAEYVSSLMESQEFSTQFFKCELNGTMICGGLFMHCGDIVQYHLSGSDDQHYRLAPTKLMLDTVREWANDVGATTFHLGGGVGGSADSLFRFKKGFSKHTHEFTIWRWILDESCYADLCATYDEVHGPVEKDGFFPYYRTPHDGESSS